MQLLNNNLSHISSKKYITYYYTFSFVDWEKTHSIKAVSQVYWVS